MGLLQRIRQGEADAATEVVQSFERIIRAAVRIRLTDPALRRQFDSIDICQSVLASFFIGIAAGQYDISSREQLVGLLVTMAEHKFRNRNRDAHRLRRNVARTDLNADPATVACERPSPSEVALHRDTLANLMQRLTAEERDIVRHRAAGNSWEEIGATLGGTPEARRMQLRRAVSRACEELHLDDPSIADA